jgi:L-amino acid N-acyltransferase YncA
MGILPYFMEQTCLMMRAQGYRKALAVVYNDNYSSRRCFEKIGFQKGELTRHFVIPLLKRKYCVRKIFLP